MKAQRFFRYVWRIDALLILLIAPVAFFGVGSLIFEEFGARAAARRNVQAGIQITAEQRTDLTLGHADSVPGSPVLRADLTTHGESGKFSSGGYSETRNILFIDPDQKNARWLLPDNDNVIEQRSDVEDVSNESNKRLVATAAIIEPRDEQSESPAGRLVLFNASGKSMSEVAKNVSNLQLATLSGNEIVLLYERNRHLVRATFDSSSLSKRREQEIEVPELK